MQSMVVKLVVVLAVLLGSHWMAYEHGKKATSQQIEQAYRDYKKKLDDAVNEYDVRVEQVVKEKDEQIANINDVLAASVSAPVPTVFGIPLEEWTYILSAIVSLLFILEKLPKMIRKVRDWIKQRACKE